jgi:hypothetical protein
MTSTNKPKKIALCLILLFTALGITQVNATTENNYKHDIQILPRISESTHTENGYKAAIIMNPHTTGIYTEENGYKTELTINPHGIGGKHTENNYQLDLIPEKMRRVKTQEYARAHAPPPALIPVTPPVGGIWIPVDKLVLLAPYIALASTILIATAATTIYVKHAKRRKKKQ